MLDFRSAFPLAKLVNACPFLKHVLVKIHIVRWLTVRVHPPWPSRDKRTGPFSHKFIHLAPFALLFLNPHDFVQTHLIHGIRLHHPVVATHLKFDMDVFSWIPKELRYGNDNFIYLPSLDSGLVLTLGEMLGLIQENIHYSIIPVL